MWNQIICQLFVVSACCMLSSLALKPIKNLRVYCKNRSYVIDNVSTIEELKTSLRKKTGLSNEELRDAKILFKGAPLENVQSLQRAGVADGSPLLVAWAENLEAGQMTGHLYLALVLSCLEAEDHTMAAVQMLVEQVKELATETRGMKAPEVHDISNNIRYGTDKFYRGLRSLWERPDFRYQMQHPGSFEPYREVLASLLPRTLLQNNPGAKRIVEDPELWRRQVADFAATILHFGDVALEAMLMVVLDLLKGVGKSSPSLSGKSSRDGLQQTMEDPNLANDLLFELSESDGDE